MLNILGGGGNRATCAQQLAIARGVPPPPAAISGPATATVSPAPTSQPVKPPKPADMLRSLFR